MARGTCYYLTTDKEDDGELFDAGVMDESDTGGFRYAIDFDSKERIIEVIHTFVEGLQRWGVSVDVMESAVTITREAAQNYFASRFEKFKAAVASISLADFASDSGNYWDLRGFMENGYSDGVWFEDTFYTMDSFVRHVASSIPEGQEGITYYVRGACLIN